MEWFSWHIDGLLLAADIVIMSDHQELVAEMATVEKMPISERLKLAKKRRAMQLKSYAQFEKQSDRDKDRKSKGSAGKLTEDVHRKTTNQLRFTDSILLLDAAVKNDLVEGNGLELCVCICLELNTYQ